MKLLIIGHAQHGKDTLAEIWERHFGLKFKGSSMAAAEIFIFDALKDIYGYKTFEECFEDRKNHRDLWHDMITEYNKDDKARLAKEILAISDCYVGMRNDLEVTECFRLRLFDLVIWVDASKRKPLEPKSSFKIGKEWADIIIDNNGCEFEFVRRAKRIGRIIFNDRSTKSI